MTFFKNFTIKMVKMNFILWKIAIKHNLIENTKLFFFLVCVYIYITYQIKKCVYNKKACVYVYVGGCFDKYISVATWPP